MSKNYTFIITGLLVTSAILSTTVFAGNKTPRLTAVHQGTGIIGTGMMRPEMIGTGMMSTGMMSTGINHTMMSGNDNRTQLNKPNNTTKKQTIIKKKKIKPATVKSST